MKATTTDTEKQMKIEDQLCFALYSTSRAITKQYAPLLKKLNVTYPQYLALLVLWQRDGILVQEVASSLEIDQATATPLIQRLENSGIVQRQRSKEDERKVQVFLTSKGRKLYKLALSVPEELGCAIGVDQKLAQKLIKEMNRIKNTIQTKADI